MARIIANWQVNSCEFAKFVAAVLALPLKTVEPHFVFVINSQIVYETDDDRQPVGGVALMVEVQGDGTKILFDNFGFQSR